MSAYVIFNYLRVHDEDRILEYRKQAHPTVAEYGGRVRVRPGELHRLEGPASQYLIITEFDDLQAAQAWYDSPEYQLARKIREAAADVQVMIVPGVLTRSTCTAAPALTPCKQSPTMPRRLYNYRAGGDRLCHA